MTARIGSFMSVATVLLAQVVVPEASAQQRTFAFDIRAGSLDAALRQYARTTGRQILYRGVTVDKRRFSGMTATLDADAALLRILAGTGLRSVSPARDVIVIQAGTSSDDTFPAVVQSSDPVAEIVVTGSNIRGGTPTTSVRTLTRRQIEQSGKATLSDAIAALPSNFGGTGNPVAALTGADRSSLNYSVAPAANLRGLGSDATLTLFDGRRVAGSGGRGDFTDLSAIPSLAVDRVEILADGASAIYGSDAVGGVVNILLRHRFDGIETRLRGSTVTGGGASNGLASVLAGKTWASGSALLAYEFEHRDALSGADRAYTATGDLRAFGGTDHRTFYASPATILGFDPQSGGFVPRFAVPVLPGGAAPTLAQLVPGQNLSNPIAGLDLSPVIDRHAVYARIDQQFALNLAGYVEGRYARRTFSYQTPPQVAAVVITAANPYFLSTDGLPFGLLGYSFYPELGAGRAYGGVSALSTTAGLDWTPGGGWGANAYASFSRQRSHDETVNLVNSSALSEALGTAPDDLSTAFSTARDGFFNPYGSGSSNARPILDFVGSGYTRLRRRSSVVDTVLKADGPVVTLPGGTARLALGGSFRRETFTSGGATFYTGNVPLDIVTPDGRRDVKAIFAEANIPILQAANAVPGIRALTLSAALRHEDYSDFGTTTNPRIGLAWIPAPGLTLRGSWGKSFRAPALAEINDRRSVSPTQLPNGLGGYSPVILIGGGNQALGPERATTWSGGVVVEPDQIKGFRAELNVFSTRFRDRIGQPALQDILRALTDPSLAPFVERITPATSAADLARVTALLAEPNAASAEGLPPSVFSAIIDGRYVNTGRLSVSGLDADASFTTTEGSSTWGAAVSATWLFRYATQATPLSSTLDRLDTLSNPAAIRLRGSATWSRGIGNAAVFVNHTTGYRNDSVIPLGRIASFTTLDLNLSLAPTRGLLRGFRFALAVENLFDADPPFVDRASGIGFDAANASPFGRTLALEVRRSW